MMSIWHIVQCIKIYLKKRVRLRVKFLCYKFMISILKKRIIVRERRLSFYHLKYVLKRGCQLSSRGFAINWPNMEFSVVLAAFISWWLVCTSQKQQKLYCFTMVNSILDNSWECVTELWIDSYKIVNGLYVMYSLWKNL